MRPLLCGRMGEGRREKGDVHVQGGKDVETHSVHVLQKGVLIMKM